MAPNIALVAVSTVSALNVWLLWANVRWFGYHTALLGEFFEVDRFRGVLPVGTDPGAESLALIIGAISLYILGYRLIYRLINLRSSMFYRKLLRRAAVNHSFLLIGLMLMSVSQWILLTDYVPIDLPFAVSAASVIAIALIATREERRDSDYL